MFSIIGVLVLVVLLFKVFDLSSRVAVLEKAIKSPVVAAPAESLSAAVPPADNLSMYLKETREPQAPQASSAPAAPNPFIEWLKEDWLLKIGALILLIGLGWLVTYAFMNNWIGPMGRITLGLVAGVIILILGTWRSAKFVNQGGIFLTLGSTIILVTVFAARSIYSFFDPLTAILVMLASIVYVAVMSLKIDSKVLALLSLVMAGIAPLLTNSNDPTLISLFMYLAVVVLGVIWLVTFKNWRFLVFASLLMVAAYSFYPLTSYMPAADFEILLYFAYGFALVFFATNTLMLTRKDEADIAPDIFTAGGTGLFLLAWILKAAPAEWQSLVMAGWMLIFALGAFAVFQATGKRAPFMTYGAVSAMMLAAATTVELNGEALVMALTAECVLAALVAYTFTRKVDLSERVSLLLVVPIMMSLEYISDYKYSLDLLDKNFAVLVALMIATFIVGSFNYFERQAKPKSTLSWIYIVASSVYLYVTLWYAIPKLVGDARSAVGISLFIFTVIGLITYISGRLREVKALKAYGGFLLGFVILRLLFIDVWQMELSARIVTFIAIGLLLISTAFIGRKKQN